MAGQDFAQVKVPIKSESNGSSGSLFAVFGIVFVAIACFAAGFWLGGNQGAQQDIANPELDAARAQIKVKSARVELLQVKIDALQELVDEWKKKSEQGASAKLGELKFYHDLPRQSVTPAPVSDSPTSRTSVRPVLPPHPSKPSAEKSTNIKVADKRVTDKAVKKVAAASSAVRAAAKDSVVYQVQVVSYRVEDEAAKFQKKLFNAGYSAFIRSVDLAGKGTWYRVYAGPYSNKNAAEKAQNGIQKLTKLKGLLVRDR